MEWNITFSPKPYILRWRWAERARRVIGRCVAVAGMRLGLRIYGSAFMFADGPHENGRGCAV